jgi:hypothetical protein
MEILYRISHTSFLQSKQFIVHPIFRWDDCFFNFSQSETKIANRDNVFNSYLIDASCKILLYLGKWFHRRFLEIDKPETRIA